VSPDRVIKSKVAITEALGSEVMVHFGVDAPQVFTDGAKKNEDEDVHRLSGEHGATFVGSFNARTRVRPGDVIDVAVNTSHLHFFDPVTGERL
jgi:multiple sugar transport system ATP-binding protein